MGEKADRKQIVCIYFKRLLMIEQQAIKFRALDDWFCTEQGRHVAASFSSQMDPIYDQINGDCLLQLGCCGDNIWLKRMAFVHKWIVTPYLHVQKSYCIASMDALPFEHTTMQCVIAPLVLEAFSHPIKIIDEIDRILKPMGYVVLFGINPWSLWGACLKLKFSPLFARQTVTLSSSFHVKRIFLSRGYYQFVHSSFYFIPPVTKAYMVKKLAFLNEMGKMIWPFPAGFYCLILQKRQGCPPGILVNELKESLIVRA